MLRTSSLTLLNGTGYFEGTVLKEPLVAQLCSSSTSEPRQRAASDSRRSELSSHFIKKYIQDSLPDAIYFIFFLSLGVEKRECVV